GVVHLRRLLGVGRPERRGLVVRGRDGRGGPDRRPRPVPPVDPPGGAGPMTTTPQKVEPRPEPEPAAAKRGARGRVYGFVGLCVVCVAVGVGYVVHSGGRTNRAPDATGAVAAGAPSAAAVMAKPHLLVGDMAAGQAGYAGVLPLAGAGGPKAVTDLPCARLYMEAGNGLCLSDHGDILNHYKVVFFWRKFHDRSEKPRHGGRRLDRLSVQEKYVS